MKRIVLIILLVVLATAPSASAATIVRVVAPTNALENPGFGKVVKRVPTVTPYGHDQLALRVLNKVEGVKANGQSVTYYRVHLPYRRSRLDSSNGHTGWVSSDTVAATSTPYRIVVNTRRHRLYIYRGAKVWKHWPIVNGARRTPTPKGKFAIYGKTTRDHGFDGTGIATFAYSRVWATFDGGQGKVALHGRSGASFRTPLGTAGSNGCVRMNNANMEIILSRMPIGTPVDVI